MDLLLSNYKNQGNKSLYPILDKKQVKYLQRCKMSCRFQAVMVLGDCKDALQNFPTPGYYNVSDKPISELI